MSKVISVYNNKGGVGKTVLAWNIADALARKGHRILLIDFDPQCNLSLAVLGEETFIKKLPSSNLPYGLTLRAFLQLFVQNLPGGEVHLHKGVHTHKNVDLIAGDFWLNVYADSLSVGSDLLAGTGLAKYVVIWQMIRKAEEAAEKKYNYVIIDLPPSFGSLVRTALYSSTHFIVPCASDNFSAYCVGLIGQKIPSFLREWRSGLARFQEANPNFTDCDTYGKPVFAGWIFNGFDTARKRRTPEEVANDAPKNPIAMMAADKTHHDRIVTAVKETLIRPLMEKVTDYNPVAEGGSPPDFVGARRA